MPLEKVLLVCQSPQEPEATLLLYCTDHPAGAVTAANVKLVGVLLSSLGVGAVGAFGTFMVLVVDHALSVLTLNAPVPLLCLARTSIVEPGALFVIVLEVNVAQLPPATLHSL